MVENDAAKMFLLIKDKIRFNNKKSGFNQIHKMSNGISVSPIEKCKKK